jgi:hydroxyethylthiazole kinase-like uncharacterized protein yjeF
MLHRDTRSHKGENGKVLIVGGSRFIHGAPLFSLLAAEASGVDLLFLALPACHEHCAKAACRNAQVHPFGGDELADNDVDMILELMATVDVAVVGPGLGRSADSLKALERVIASAACPLVLDATALQASSMSLARGRDAVLTPHAGELERMGIPQEKAAEMAKTFELTFVCKGPTDRIIGSDGNATDVTGGDAGLTVGGTGDALAGLIAGLKAQRMATVEACAAASRTIKRAGEMLRSTHGHAYKTDDVIGLIPRLLKGDADGSDKPLPFRRGPMIA